MYLKGISLSNSEKGTSLFQTRATGVSEVGKKDSLRTGRDWTSYVRSEAMVDFQILFWIVFHRIT